jgi:hypothetical protein
VSVTASVTASATAPAVPQDWLQVDTTAAERGYKPAQYGDPATDPAPPVVPVTPSPLPPGTPVTAPDAGGVVYDSDGEGAWPALPEGGDGRTWIDRGDGFPQGAYETTAPRTSAPGMWAGAEPLQTYDYVYQSTDSEGWRQNVPNGRQSARNTFGQGNPGNNPTWYGYGENPALAHLAITAVPLTPDAAVYGTPGFSEGGLPDWAQTGGQGNTAYDTPAPPPTASAQPVSALDPAAGWA